jgi:hypothetical protein
MNPRRFRIAFHQTHLRVSAGSNDERRSYQHDELREGRSHAHAVGKFVAAPAVYQRVGARRLQEVASRSCCNCDQKTPPAKVTKTLSNRFVQIA